MDSKTLALLCREYADNKKAEDIVVLDVREVSSITDYFVIVSGSSEPHLRAISEEITDKLAKEHHLKPRAVDGTLPTAWVVLDYFDVIVHVMLKETRDHYDLERLWGDAPRVRPRRASASSPIPTPTSTSKPTTRPKAKAKAKSTKAAKATKAKPTS